MKKFALAFLIALMVIGVNIQDGFLGRLGVDTNILMVALVAVVVAGFMQFHNLGLTILIIILAIAANLPAESAASIGYDPDYVLAALVALVVVPFIAKQLS